MKKIYKASNIFVVLMFPINFYVLHLMWINHYTGCFLIFPIVGGLCGWLLAVGFTIGAVFNDNE